MGGSTAVAALPWAFRIIRIAITPAAFDALARTLPLGSVGFEREVNEKGERLIWLEERGVNKLAAMRGPGETYSDVILRLVGLAAVEHPLTGPGRQSRGSPSDSPGDTDPDMPLLAYAELADALRITPASANRLARRNAGPCYERATMAGRGSRCRRKALVRPRRRAISRRAGSRRQGHPSLHLHAHKVGHGA